MKNTMRSTRIRSGGRPAPAKRTLALSLLFGGLSMHCGSDKAETSDAISCGFLSINESYLDLDDPEVVERYEEILSRIETCTEYKDVYLRNVSASTLARLKNIETIEYSLTLYDTTSSDLSEFSNLKSVLVLSINDSTELTSLDG